MVCLCTLEMLHTFGVRCSRLTAKKAPLNLLAATEGVQGRLAAGIRVVHTLHSWYASRCHKDTSSWECGLAMVALEKRDRQPVLFSALFLAALKVSPPPLGTDSYKKTQSTRTN